jgi:tRNA pseudouridine13 synthase
LNRIYFLNHSEIEFYFKQSVDDFVVSEEPLYEFTGDGEHMVLTVRKKNLTTWEMLKIFADTLKINQRDIGYAGLKDKKAMTIQHISINRKYEEALNEFEDKNIKILEKTYHKNKIKVGHLKGNRFFIRLKKVNPLNAKKLNEAIKNIKEFGIPNYFGFQRFGITKENYTLGKAIIDGTKRVRDRREEKFLISAYQSYLFNAWLSKRLELSKLIESLSISELHTMFGYPKELIKTLKAEPHPFKILTGDIMHHYPFGKAFSLESIEDESKRFMERDIVPTGLLSGKRASISTGLAYDIEKEFIDEKIKNSDGSRRFAWIYPTHVETKYKESEFWYELNFFLPKGSYATVLIEELAHKELLS